MFACVTLTALSADPLTLRLRLPVCPFTMAVLSCTQHTETNSSELEMHECVYVRMHARVCVLPPPLCPPTPPQTDPHCCNLALASVSFHLCTAAQERHHLILCVCVFVSM